MSLYKTIVADPPWPSMHQRSTNHRGKPMVPATKILSTWHQWPRLRHSEKPAEFFSLVEQISPAPRLEMFARQARPGWDAWGNEAPGAIELPGL